jgi:hypothetical protein
MELCEMTILMFLEHNLVVLVSQINIYMCSIFSCMCDNKMIKNRSNARVFN